jgi:thiamine kinase-like enzyme
MPNPILQFFDEQFVTKLLKKRVLPLYPYFSDIKKVEIIPHKKLVWERSYHVVTEFNATFLSDKGKKKNLSIFATAHSSEPRKNVYYGLKFLWKNNFSKGFLTIPHPLFYSNFYKAAFYRGVSGHNLYYYIEEKNFKVIEEILPKTAGWFAKLHSIPTKDAKNFNKKNSRIKTVFPGVEHILDKIKEKYPEHYDVSKKIYDIIVKEEEKFLSSIGRRWLVHGDAHPENVIKMGKKKIAVIDFTDLCLSDFARDIGSFLQQLEYMCNKKIDDPEYSRKAKRIFLDNYCRHAKIKMSDYLEERINNYYNWTMMRTATSLLLQHNPRPDHAEPLLKQICKNLKIEQNNSSPC